MGLLDKWKDYKKEVNRGADEIERKRLKENPKYRAKREAEGRFRDILLEWPSTDVNKLESQLFPNKESILYANDFILKESETVLGFVGSTFGELSNAKLFGVLLATDKRLLFVQKDKKGQFKQEWKYNKINGIKDSGYPLKLHELQIEIGKSKKLFHDIKKKDQYYEFNLVLQEKINNA